MWKRNKYVFEGLNDKGNVRSHNWENTNKMLNKSSYYNGLKTGTTKTAGCWLVSKYQIFSLTDWNLSVIGVKHT